MTKFSRVPFIFILTILAIGLCGCPPLDYKIFVRNLSADTARLTLIYPDPPDSASTRSIAIKGANEIISFKKGNIKQLHETFIATVENGQATLVIPPGSTVYVTDILRSLPMFTDKSLVIEYGGKADTMKAGYPFKELKGFRRKADPSYSYFYRTIVYYDVK